MVIGADGIHSLVARQVGAPAYNTRPTHICAYYSYWSGVTLNGVEFYPREHRAFGVMPTHYGLAVVIAGWPHDEFRTIRADIEGNFLKTLELARQGKREERFIGTADLPFFFRKPYGPGWALVGDAAYHKDPITSQGISDAFRDAGLLAEAIDAGLSGRRPHEEALADYERRRNAAAMPMYEFTHQFARLELPSPEMQQLFAALRNNQEQTNRFFGTLAGTVPIPEFFAPENVGQIIGVEV
jgi:flavin-dependent dehydrogenase